MTLSNKPKNDQWIPNSFLYDNQQNFRILVHKKNRAKRRRKKREKRKEKEERKKKEKGRKIFNQTSSILPYNLEYSKAFNHQFQLKIA